MNTEKAIESLMDLCDDELNPFHVRNWYKERDEIIKLLKENEKYKKMWEELEGFFVPGKAIEIPIEETGTMNVDFLCKEFQTLNYIINNLKEKYFPKKRQKTVSFDINFDRSGDDLGWEIDTLISLRKHLNDILPEGVKLSDKITIKPFKESNVQKS